MKLDLLRGVGTGTVNNIYHKHYDQATTHIRKQGKRNGNN